MKKKLFVFMIALLMILPIVSCQNHDDLVPSKNHSVQILGEIPAKSAPITFPSQAELIEATDALAALESPEAKMQWVKSNFANFISIADIYNEANEVMATIGDESEAFFYAFKNTYSCLYFPLQGEDAGYYIPITDSILPYLANSECKIVVGTDTVNVRDIYTYEQLMETGRAYYTLPTINTRGTDTQFYLNSTSMNSVGPEYDSNWTIYNKDRKVKLKARRVFTTVPVSQDFVGSKSWIHFEFCFRKKTWLGWSNYSSSSRITGQITVTGFPYNIVLDSSHNGTSSHDVEYLYPIHISIVGATRFYRFFEAPCSVTVEYQGVGQPLNYSWTMPGIYATEPANYNPSPIFPNNL